MQLAKRERFSVQVSAEVIDKARNAVFWTPGLTMADLVEDSMSKAIAALEKKRGEPFQKRKGTLKAGRPLK